MFIDMFHIQMQLMQRLAQCNELSYDLINTVNSPTRITSSSESLIDVIVTNREYLEQRTMVIDLGLSDHLAQLIRIRSREKSNTIKIIEKRQFINLLSQESWVEVINQLDVNASVEAFLRIFLHYFNIAFPYKKKI